MKTIERILILTIPVFAIGCYTQLALDDDEAEAVSVASEAAPPVEIIVVPVYVPVPPVYVPVAPVYSPVQPAVGVVSPAVPEQPAVRDIGNHRGSSDRGSSRNSSRPGGRR